MVALVFLGLATHALTTVPLWAPPGVADQPDTFVAFRGSFYSRGETVELRAVGASEYLIWVDGQLQLDGPARYSRQHPEYQSVKLKLSAGKHLVAAQVRNNGVTTRLLSNFKPFLWCEVASSGVVEPIEWTCQRMPEFRSQAQRISGILGWIDWVDLRKAQIGWHQPNFEPKGWLTPVQVDPKLGPIAECVTRPVKLNTLKMNKVANGSFATSFGYEMDEIAARFFLDDLAPKGVPPQGVWRRYDLGRVRIGRPMITLDCAPGAIIEFGYSERLTDGRVAPWITLSGTPSCNVDHFTSRGGVQTFMPFTPKGARFIEVHIKSPEPIKVVNEEFLERTWFDTPQGSFECDDPLLNRIWKTGVETVLACADDTLVDCPTRERAQWTGDVASVAMDVAAYGMGDLALLRRSLVQAAQSARSDGLVAGVGPSDPGYLSTYAAQWTTACVHYWQLTGDKSLLVELLGAARRNMEAFEKHLQPEGLDGGLGWGFVDWGYVGNGGPSDMALNLHYLTALKAMRTWESEVGSKEKAEESQRLRLKLEGIVKRWLEVQVAKPGSWKNVGYHAAVLALDNRLIPTRQVAECTERIKTHLLSCFPNNPKAPRLSDPSLSDPQIITPYFGHWAMKVLLEHDEADFVLDQYRKCWGWALGTGATTWLEVFDTRWSHCHEWSGCPTWQLSRYFLGVQMTADLSVGQFEFAPVRSRLTRASGTVAFGEGGLLKVAWEKVGKNRKVHIESNRPVTVRFGSEDVKISGKLDQVVPW